MNYDLKETRPNGGDDSTRRFWINGKRATREEFQAIKNRAYSSGRLECMSTSQALGIYTFYSTAVLP